MIILKNQFTLSQAFKSSAIKSQYNNKNNGNNHTYSNHDVSVS